MLKCSEIYSMCWTVKGMGSPFFYSCCQTAWPRSSANVSLNTLREHDPRLSLDPKSVSLLRGKSGRFCLFSLTHATSELCSSLLWFALLWRTTCIQLFQPRWVTLSSARWLQPAAWLVLFWCDKNRERGISQLFSHNASVFFSSTA